ncbi:Cobalamin-5-phosphate synthase [Hahella chejuensis KCTC 2396]|uniref:Adenosylcobinamide-GDP ribazoletransferase n=1 Tax=Hahella chejuensis (strain KCTC 2396) TaxID=349521 RepID=Q2SNC1_HAHCH|nr:adenosylcobinamide-GDP ribazoletransferase [Hahella chejuensis]ABC27853.1 Cobalamin-5-phosphate synthase [Hahella chejuensis KCTC 2396]
MSEYERVDKNSRAIMKSGEAVSATGEPAAQRWAEILRRQWHLLMLSLQFYTRIPVRLLYDFHEADLNQASRYIALTGWLVALAAACAYLSGLYFYGPWGGAVLAVATGVLITGAFHEDGLADAADGFGGGHTPERILEIMKDSRVGTYGALALALSLSLKIVVLAQLSPDAALLLLWISHACSRALAISLIASLDYVRADQLSKVKPVAKGIATRDIAIAAGMAIAPLMLAGAKALILAAVGLWLLRRASICYLSRRLGGYTGDCLGAVQQLGEIVLFLLLGALWSSI